MLADLNKSASLTGPSLAVDAPTAYIGLKRSKLIKTVVLPIENRLYSLFVTLRIFSFLTKGTHSHPPAKAWRHSRSNSNDMPPSHRIIGYLQDKFATLLEVDKKNLYVCQHEKSDLMCHVPDHINKKHPLKDKVLNFYSFSDDIPKVKIYPNNKINMHDHFSAGYGITKVAPRDLTGKIRYDLTYLVAEVPVIYRNAGREIFLIFKKNTIYSISKLAKKKHRYIASLDLKKPILEEGKLDNIVKATIGIFNYSDQLVDYGVSVRKGVVFSGQVPGNGKTMTCRYIKDLCRINQIGYATFTSSDILKKYHGDESFDSIFNSDSVIFLDDIDISFLDRKSVRADVATALLTAFDGMDVSNDRVVIITTNEKLNSIDSAFLRPGRIDEFFEFRPPSHSVREKFVQTIWHKDIVNYLKENNLYENFIHRTEGFSFASMDYIKRILVNNYIENKSWDLEKAFDYYYQSRKDVSHNTTQRAVGLAAEMQEPR